MHKALSQKSIEEALRHAMLKMQKIDIAGLQRAYDG